MTLNIENEVEISLGFDWEKLAEDVISFVIEHEDFPYEAEVNLTLTDNGGIHEINKMYREIDRPTDVLSFPMDEFENSGHTEPLGDIVISIERAEEQAKEYGHSLMRELCFLTAHSTLHLLGYDHENGDEERLAMEHKQEEILDSLNITRDI